MALIAACALMPGDYFAINAPAAKYAQIVAANPGLVEVHLAEFSKAIGMDLHARAGGAVSLAVGMAYIFNNIPFMDNLMGYWYNFAIMFEVVFIMAAIDGVTRVGRTTIQDAIGRVIPGFRQRSWLPGVLISSALFSLLWGLMTFNNTISAIWPLFGMSNQLLGACALIVGTTMLLRLNRGKYCLCTAIPGLALAVITFWSGYLQVTGVYLPGKNYFLTVVAIVIMVLMALVFVSAIKKWLDLSNIRETIRDAYGEPVKVLVEE
jgi:carbon starvation protein